MFKFVQITDCHLGDDLSYLNKGIKPYETLSAVLQQVVKEAPDFIVATGDLVENGSIESYQLLKGLLDSTKIPYRLLPGNHDLPKNLSEIFKTQSCIDLMVNFLRWSFIFVNSVVPGQSYGALTADSLRYLRQNLQDSNDVVGIFVHHHPVPVKNQFMNKYDIKNAEEFRDIVERHSKKVKFVAFGHIHQEFEEVVNNITYYGCPATSVQFANSIDKLLVSSTQMPGYRVFNVGSNGSFETYTKIIG